ncbi:MAG TPA: RNA polymerase sigma factor [Ktedonobacteraceae bacterium]|jgi:RNA polymerase sigma-70 factor (ECF subfamily)|nr:RNA polymerase sigma factor [Ktedonobacteraceae bacterium]
MKKHEKTIKLSYQEPGDNLLVGRALAGDHRAFEVLEARYHTALYNFIGRCLGDYEQAYDVLQFVFMQLYVSLPKLHNHLTSPRSKSPLKSWLFQVAWNRCMDELRKKRPILFSEMELHIGEDDLSTVEAIPDPYPLPDEVAEQHDLRGHLRRAIDKLPPKFRSVVFLRYTEELSFGEIGHRLNMPENTAKTYFQRARPLLRASLSMQTPALAVL